MLAIKQAVRRALWSAAQRMKDAGELSGPLPPFRSCRVSEATEATGSDLSTDFAIELARHAQGTATATAGRLAGLLCESRPWDEDSPTPESVHTHPSGLITIGFATGWEAERLRRLAAGEQVSAAEPPARWLLEYVSADPTGPLNLNHARGGVVGDCLARLLRHLGEQVDREYYVNDTGSVMDRFGESVRAALQAQGTDYMKGVVHRIPEASRTFPAATAAASAMILADQRSTLDRLGVEFDRWRSESDLHSAGCLDGLLRDATARGMAFELDGAVWLQTSHFGDTQDRPLRRSNGRFSYFAADLAYHLDKLSRGYSHVLNIWGADHEDYTSRTQAGLLAMGADASRVEYLILHSVRARIDGLDVGSAAAVPVEDLLERSAPAYARLALLSTPVDQPIELDLDQSYTAPTVGLSASREDNLARQIVYMDDAVHAAVEARDPSILLGAAREAAAGLAEAHSQLGAGADDRLLQEAGERVVDTALGLLGLREVPRSVLGGSR